MIFRYSRTILKKKNYLFWSIFLYLKVITQLPMQLRTSRFYYMPHWAQPFGVHILRKYLHFNQASLTRHRPILYPMEMGKNRIHTSHTRCPSLPTISPIHDRWTPRPNPWGHTRKQGRPRTRWRDDLDSFGKTLTLCSVKQGPVEVNGEGLCPTS